LILLSNPLSLLRETSCPKITKVFFIKNPFNLRRKRIILIDEITESCRLMPTFMQSLLFGLMFGIATLLIPTLTYFFFYTIIFFQATFIILLVQKNLVYRRISKLKNAIQKKIIWIHTKEDKKDLLKKRGINLLLVALTLFLYFKITSINLLIVNGLFCLLFSLKIIFFVPLLSLRIIEDRDLSFQIINEQQQENIEVEIFKIKNITLDHNTLIIDTKDDFIHTPIHFKSTEEYDRVFYFLRGLEELKGKIIENKIA